MSETRVSPGDMVPSQCLVCRRLSKRSPLVCAAFPGLIPAEIRLNAHDHRKPWIDPESGEPGDQGMPLAGSILFEPRADAAPEALAAVAAYFDRPTQEPPQ